MSVREIPVVGKLVGLASLLLDLLLNSGELVIAIVWVAIENIEIVLSLVITLQRLSENVPWLPDDVVQQVAIAMFAMMLVVYLGRLLGKLGEDDDS